MAKTIKIKRDPAKAKRLIGQYERELVALFDEYRTTVTASLGLRQLAATDRPMDATGITQALSSAVANLMYKGRLITRQATLQAWNHGQTYADLQLKRHGIEVSQSFQASPDWRALDILRTRNLTALQGITDEVNKRIVSELTDGIMKGEGMDKLAKRLTDTIDTIGITRARMVARTETMYSVNQASLTRYYQYGVRRVQWIAGADGRCCDECLELNGKIFEIDRVPDIPVHPNCLLPGTRLKAPGGIVAGLRAMYDGEVVELVFTDGAQLTVTPNHMLLTPHGFAAANLLREGDEVFYCPDFEGVVTSDPNNNNMPSVVEEIFESLRVAPGMLLYSVPLSAENLHGDAGLVNGNIDVIAPDSLLRGTDKSALLKHFGTFNFGAANPDAHSLSGLSPLAKAFLAAAAAADGGMSGIRKSHPFFLGRLAHPEIHGVATATGSNTGFFESSNDGRPVGADLLRDGLNGLAGVVKSENLVDVQFESDASGLNPGIAKPAADGRLADSKNLGDLFNGFTTLVKTNKVIGINRKAYHGYVYDFQTISSLCISNSIITSNCRCTTAPVTQGETP